MPQTNGLTRVLSSTVRNYVLSHTSDVFLASYQPRQVRQDLIAIAFSQPSDPTLFHLLRTASAGRDENAPLYPDTATLQSFEQRPDVRKARAEHDKVRQTHGAGSKEYRRSRFQVEFLLKEPSKQAVERDRKSYFELVDRLRAEEKVTTDLILCPPPNPHRSQYWHSLCAAAEIGRFFHRADPGEDDTSAFRVMLLDFLGNRKGEGEVVSAAVCQHRN